MYFLISRRSNQMLHLYAHMPVISYFRSAIEFPKQVSLFFSDIYFSHCLNSLLKNLNFWDVSNVAYFSTLQSHNSYKKKCWGILLFLLRCKQIRTVWTCRLYTAFVICPHFIVNNDRRLHRIWIICWLPSVSLHGNKNRKKLTIRIECISTVDDICNNFEKKLHD